MKSHDLDCGHTHGQEEAVSTEGCRPETALVPAITASPAWTAGPWWRDASLRHYEAPMIRAGKWARGSQRVICKVLYEGGSEDPEVMANARLIAAAPDLADLASRFERRDGCVVVTLDNGAAYAWADDDDGIAAYVMRHICAEARAAYAKARGQ